MAIALPSIELADIMICDNDGNNKQDQHRVKG